MNNDNKEKKIFTIGHSNYSIEDLLRRIKPYHINCIIDIRGIPYSKYNVQYNKEELAVTLRKLGYTYIYMAKEFAAKRFTKESYNEEGYANFEEVIKEESFKSGIRRLEVGLDKGFNILLLGAMQEPVRCHRAILVGKELNKKGFNIKHILHNEEICDQKEIEEMLLNKYFPSRNQITIDSLLGNDINEEILIEEGYKLANKEIGYRMEKIEKD